MSILRSIALALLLADSAVAAKACEREYRFVTEAGLENAGPNMGSSALRKIMAQANCKLIEIRSTPNFRRRQKMLSDGEIDVLSEASMRPERLVYGLFSDPYRMEATYLFVRADRSSEFNRATLKDVENGNWRVLDSGSWYGQTWDVVSRTLRKRNLMIPQRSVAEGLRDLRLGRADILVATDLSEASVLKNAEDLTRLPFKVNVEPVHLLFSRRTVSKRDVEFINHAIATLKKNGKL